MRKIDTPIQDLYIIELDNYKDERGFFVEYFNHKNFCDLGLNVSFVQDNHSFSYKNVIRGLHAQPNQGKLVGAINGTIFDVAIDIRPNSSSYGEYFGINLNAELEKLLWIPDGFLHGFQVLSETANVFYKVTDYYNPSTQFGVRWNDPNIGINWPNNHTPLINERDKNLPLLP